MLNFTAHTTDPIPYVDMTKPMGFDYGIYEMVDSVFSAFAFLLSVEIGVKAYFIAFINYIISQTDPYFMGTHKFINLIPTQSIYNGRNTKISATHTLSSTHTYPMTLLLLSFLLTLAWYYPRNTVIPVVIPKKELFMPTGLLTMLRSYRHIRPYNEQ